VLEVPASSRTAGPLADESSRPMTVLLGEAEPFDPRAAPREAAEEELLAALDGHPMSWAAWAREAGLDPKDRTARRALDSASRAAAHPPRRGRQPDSDVMSVNQLVLPGLEDSPWHLLRDPARRVSAGPAKLLRDLVREGLDPEALPAAAALMIELDKGAER